MKHWLIEFIDMNEYKTRQIECDFETLQECIKFAENNAENDEFIKIYEKLQ